MQRALADVSPTERLVQVHLGRASWAHALGLAKRSASRASNYRARRSAL